MCILLKKKGEQEKMKISRVSIAILFASILLMMVAIPSGAARKGVREDDMAIYYYATQEAAYTALSTGDIDFILYDITSAQADNAFTNPNIVTVNVPDSGFYEFDLNNNYTITAYPGIRSPMNYTELRQACAFLSDKDYYVGTLHNNKAVRIDQMVAAPYYGWADETKSYPYYPYEYDPAAAKAVLDSKFPVGTTPNPNYDSGDPLSSPYLRHYPDDHSLAGTDLDPLIFYVRSEHNARLMSGRAVYQALQKMGVPIDATEAPSTVTYTPVMGEFNYHFYTGGWSVGRFPPLSLYGLYHSSNAFPYGSNYVTGADFNAVNPSDYVAHPILDNYLYQTNYAASYSDAVTYCKMAAGYMTDICVNVPLWSVSAYWAWNKNLLGMVNQQGADPENGYGFANAYKVDGSPIRCGTINYATSINIVYSNWVYDYNNVDRMNLYGGIDVPAYNVAADQVGFCNYFETTTWMDGADEKTKVIQNFRTGGYACEPVSGDQGEEITANHYFWNAWFDYQLGDTWFSTGFIDLHHVNIINSTMTEIYFDTYSYWNTYYCQGPLRPMYHWMTIPALVSNAVEAIPLAGGETPGPITLGHTDVEGPIWFDYVEFNDVPLTLGTDYNIVLGELYLYGTLGAGTLDVSYYYVPSGACRGFFVGNLPWQDINDGAGEYYMTSYSSGVSATYKRNPFYYLVTPLLGEIDFVKKPSGNYKVDIFDLALAGGAYGSQGTGIPSSNWFPGADLAPEGGKVDILDLVTVTGTNWDAEYDPIEP
jgi:ABC-type transport system substrate-binding protein